MREQMAVQALTEALAEIMTAAEVAKSLRCSKAHIHNLISGRVSGLTPLPAIRLGRRSLVRKGALLQWLEESEAKTAKIRSSPTLDTADA
jgi:excisionase family DNA binding protein